MSFLSLIGKKFHGRSSKQRRTNDRTSSPIVSESKSQISKILKGQAVCQYRFEIPNLQEAHSGVVGELGCDVESKVSVFSIGSAFHLIIAVAWYRVLKGQVKHKKGDLYHALKDQWEEDAFIVANRLRKLRGEGTVASPVNHKPTLKELLIHINGLPPLDYRLEDMSRVSLPGVLDEIGNWADSSWHVAGICKDLNLDPNLTSSSSHLQESEEDMYAYSTANILLSAAILTLASGQGLAETLDDLVLQPLSMLNTVLTTSEMQRLKDENGNRVIPSHYTRDEDGDVRREQNVFPRNDFNLLRHGGYSCIEDMSKLAGFIHQLFKDDDARTKVHFKYTFSSVDDKENCYQPSLFGFMSLLRWPIAPFESSHDCAYELGKVDGEHLVVTSMPHEGYGSSWHFMLGPEMFITVVVNLAGKSPLTRYVSDELAQSFYGLEPSVDIASVLDRPVCAAGECAE